MKTKIIEDYKDCSIIQAKNPESWSNGYLVTPDKFYVYKVTDKRTGKYYIGSKTTLDVDRYYIGYNYFTSSTDIEFVDDFKKNTNKYKHEVLKYFTDKQQCLDYEADLIEEAWNNDKDNLINKGYVRKSVTTHHVVSSSANTPEAITKRAESFKETWTNKSEEEKREIVAKRGTSVKRAKESWSDEKRTEVKSKISTSLTNYFKTHENPNRGRKQSDEIKKKISETVKKLHQQGVYKGKKRPVNEKAKQDSIDYQIYKSNGGELKWNQWRKLHRERKL